MQSPPRIVILEDELPQRLAVRAALHGIGELLDFGDSGPALDFLKTHLVDAAIVDIHLPHCSIDGMDFIRTLRSFDRDVCVIIRTGDASTGLADGAIEVGAFRRALKGKISIPELRALTLSAIDETRKRRQLSSDAAKTVAVKTQWVRTLGTVEEALSASDCYRGLLREMRNQLTAIAGNAEVMVEASSRARTALVDQCARQNRQLVGQLIADLRAFLEGPFAETRPSPDSTGRGLTNGALNSLRNHLLASPQWEAGKRSVRVSGLAQDVYVSVNPFHLLTALRHLVEFCFMRSAAHSQISVAARCVERAADEIESIRDPKLVIGSPASHPAATVVVRVISRLQGVGSEEIRRAFHDFPEDPRTGNLQMVTLALRDARAAIVVFELADGRVAFDLFLPVAT